MNLRPFRKRLAVTSAGLAAATACLVAVGPALAAHPKAGKKYAGFTSGTSLHGFKPPVRFKVSSDGSLVLGFKWAGAGCLGGISPGPGNPWKDKNLNYMVGTISIAGNGKFSVKNAKASHMFSGDKVVTTSSVTGSFKTAGTATGTITFKQRETGPGITPVNCGPKKVKFTATAV
jgi:hypothetical protein